jgi:hypothetical protein
VTRLADQFDRFGWESNQIAGNDETAEQPGGAT